jgi:hypothetical protein
MFTPEGLVKVIGGLLLLGGLWWFFTSPPKTSSVAPTAAVSTAADPRIAPPAPAQQLGNASAPEPLHVRVRSNGVRLYIENADTGDWSHCSLDINFQGTSGYSYKYLDVASQATGAVSLNDFARGDGERFDPAKNKLQSLYLDCDTAAGRRNWAGQFG